MRIGKSYYQPFPVRDRIFVNVSGKIWRVYDGFFCKLFYLWETKENILLWNVLSFAYISWHIWNINFFYFYWFFPIILSPPPVRF